ncbi:PREDICTED: uncharacterized protein LOC106811030 [Priapulus caudatus]|uniref:Uncharacterized protein LOC106811030 n=1 Tax=Priapulus caudatus TaxID=37621 RepID=A0ABM1ECW2_PRICU|nr:PREDICTED: uncharacterized protein LOC106811030 [Priapulus caudatus]
MERVIACLFILLVAADAIIENDDSGFKAKRVACSDICLLGIPSENCRCSFQFFTKRASRGMKRSESQRPASWFPIDSNDYPEQSNPAAWTAYVRALAWLVSDADDE